MEAIPRRLIPVVVLVVASAQLVVGCREPIVGTSSVYDAQSGSAVFFGGAACQGENGSTAAATATASNFVCLVPCNGKDIEYVDAGGATKDSSFVPLPTAFQCCALMLPLKQCSVWEESLLTPALSFTDTVCPHIPGSLPFPLQTTLPFDQATHVLSQTVSSMSLVVYHLQVGRMLRLPSFLIPWLLRLLKLILLVFRLFARRGTRGFA
ncbi:hypothetical protein BCR33DRAFT_446644 [Rhizoclosmatium globosum]|uniref:Uncharacterized protein n=1 Tax=Rhizoclosmatium globosum TaxID=329046 RepID=A0A1Y2BTW8_9FUNG|nr:hypothetical protein BCR33DRAFT_446644 [Rhizoclosmatium globosum]|eukprot:ORY37565.1 hypothetical protein BCR33DRAFT_446644 [Rhizoclosmatium globosum]